MKEGNLHKEGGGPLSRWQNRWFRLTSKSLSWFKSKDDTQPQGAVPCNEIVAVEKLVGERAGKHHCFSLAVAGKDKVYQLAADTKEERDSWVEALSGPAQSPLDSGVKYVTVETYSTHGVRVTGDPGHHILAQIGNGVASEKKRRDERGWFCDRHLPFSIALNLFSHHGWALVKTYESESVSSIDGTMNPCNVAIFCKGAVPSPVPSPISPTMSGVIPHSLAAAGTRSFSSAALVSAATRPVSLLKDAGDMELIEGADDELAKLMQEFNIPLELLYVGKDS